MNRCTCKDHDGGAAHAALLAWMRRHQAQMARDWDAQEGPASWAAYQAAHVRPGTLSAPTAVRTRWLQEVRAQAIEHWTLAKALEQEVVSLDDVEAYLATTARLGRPQAQEAAQEVPCPCRRCTTRRNVQQRAVSRNAQEAPAPVPQDVGWGMFRRQCAAVGHALWHWVLTPGPAGSVPVRRRAKEWAWMARTP